MTFSEWATLTGTELREVQFDVPAEMLTSYDRSRFSKITMLARKH